MTNEIPPIVRELFALLPAPGEEFPLVDRLRWMRAAEAIFKMIYRDDAAAAVVFKARNNP